MSTIQVCRSDGRGEARFAVAGMSCRFPGVPDGLISYWESIHIGRVLVGKVPFTRWDLDSVVASDPTLSEDAVNRMAYGGFVDDLDLFDAIFFGVSTSEASAMDPQQKLLLELAYLSLCDAGGQDSHTITSPCYVACCHLKLCTTHTTQDIPKAHSKVKTSEYLLEFKIWTWQKSISEPEPSLVYIPRVVSHIQLRRADCHSCLVCKVLVQHTTLLVLLPWLRFMQPRGVWSSETAM